MIHEVGYNSQRDNLNYGGKFPGYWQCFSTCAWMFMSYYSPLFDAENDDALVLYLDDVEDSIGKPGIGEKIKQKYNWITGKTSYWWLVQQAGIQSWLDRAKVPGKVEYSERKISFFDLKPVIDKGPVILQTDKMGGLPGGHIILAVGYDSGAIICNDPYGNAVTRYKYPNGKAIKYDDGFLMKYAGPMVRCIYLKK